VIFEERRTKNVIDFLMIATRPGKRGAIEVYPKFVIKKSSDLMIRGRDFYAVWVEDRGLWSTDEQDALQLIDRELDRYAEEYRHKFDGHVKVCYMWDAENGMIDSWHKYCQKRMRDSYHMLDEKLIFSNDGTNKKDYASKRLNYPLEPGDTPAYERLISTLYSEEERAKIEWAIGAIVSGDSKKIQKFMVLYGAAGTGKSTILNIIQQLFEGYYSVFDAKALGSASNQFSLEAFKDNPLVAIQHDGDLSRIEDNTRLNSLVSHELMTVNEKFKGQYTNRFKCFLFMGTNKPVKITDAKSGLIRRLIDVSPSGNKLDPKEYKTIMKQVTFELGAIAYHCQEVYLGNPGRYDDYIPMAMMGASNDFYNFIIDSYHIFKKEDGTTLKAAWEMYKVYCDEARVPYPLSQKSFKEELKNYFWEYSDRFSLDDGSRVRSYYSGFRTDKFETQSEEKPKQTRKQKLIQFNSTKSIFDKERSGCPAQYASVNETPMAKWDNVTTKLSELDTSKLHYVKVPENHIVIDFDIPDENGNKCYEKNVQEASKWPPTYAELSKSGAGVHLHYIYTGDVSRLSRVYDDRIEIKVFTGKSSLRRKLTKCNDLPIATISSGLPLKGEDKLVNFEGVKNEKMLRAMIKKNLNKEYHNATKPSIDYIGFLLDDAYSKGIGYDVSDMRNAVLAFAANSTNQAEYCVKLVNKMHFKSEEPSENVENDDSALVFYDVEVFPNLFLVNWKIAGEGKPVVRMINPKPAEIETLLKFRLVGFNCRRYDNHILYARLMGYDNEQLYKLSKKIINKGDESKGAFFGEAYNLSYTDVHDFAATKQSLKKWEIELGIHHQELGLPWDQPVPEELWTKVAEYCDNDVIATEAVFNHLKGDFTARQILADLAGGSVNDTTNSLTGKIIFGKNRKPQNEFNYRNLAEPVKELDSETIAFLKDVFPEMMAQRHGPAKSLLPYFEGYTYKNGKSVYKGEEVGEGGRVTAKPGIWSNVALLDITSMHPHSAMAEVLFGAKFTRRFYEIVYGRVHIKHEAWDEVNQMLDGKLTPYIQKVIDGEMSSGDLADALKIAINSVYGLTAAKFDNLFRDRRNVDNIVAKRGALFMVDLQEEVEKRGFIVCHCKTDSIKVPNATLEIIQFVMEFGKKYGYTFEHEATYDRMCLVNNAVYIARYKDVEWCEAQYGYIPSKQKKNAGKWTATGKQFQVPYVFKKLFSKEDILFEDMCETKEVKSAIYLDRNENLPDGEHDYHFVGRVGAFCPVKPGCGGAELVREATDSEGNIKYDSVTGTLKPDKTPYRWLEAEMVKTLGKEADIDLSYYNKLVDDAVEAISEYGDFEWFVSDDSSESPEPPEVAPWFKPDDLDLPWRMPCGKDSCIGCPNFTNQPFDMDCTLGHDISDVICVLTQANKDKKENN
jgi:energy-coupling factor transporter ATP-binding protein EcfA2